MGDMVTGREPHHQGNALVPSTFLLSLCLCPEATAVQKEIRPRWVYAWDCPIIRPLL